MYQERTSRLAGAVVWTRTGGGPCRIVPDGCMDLIWDDATLRVAGTDTHAHVAPGVSGRVTGLRFAPGAGPAIFGVPGHALRNQRVRLEDVWAPADARWLAEQLATGGEPGSVLERVSAERMHQADHLPSTAAIVRELRAGTRVAVVADAIGISERQLHRRCLDAFGYGPKMLARVLRLQGALRLAYAGVPYATIAARSGYADQAHMAREVKVLAGVPLGELTH